MKVGISGVTAETPKELVFGAGTIHKGLKETSGAWNFDESIVGATSEGTKLSIVPEITRPEIDGVWVPVRGLSRKTGETATMEVKFVTITPDIIKAATLGTDGTSSVGGASVIESKADILDSDYWENVAFVGVGLDGEPVIVILDNALCTSGLEMESKNKENAVISMTFECHADISSGADKLPWRIIYPARTGA